MKATHRVLVVDDDPVVSSSIDRVLSGKGYAVISAANGEEAFERLAREDYDVVYTDIRMPGMSGLEVARRIKASRPWMPVVIVTGYGTEANENEALQIGTSGFLRKPLSPDMIEGSLEHAVATASVTVAAPAAAPAAVQAPAPMTAGRFLKNAALFVASPFIGLVYVLAFPFVGLGVVAWMGIRSLSGHGKPE